MADYRDSYSGGQFARLAASERPHETKPIATQDELDAADRSLARQAWLSWIGEQCSDERYFTDLTKWAYNRSRNTATPPNPKGKKRAQRVYAELHDIYNRRLQTVEAAITTNAALSRTFWDGYTDGISLAMSKLRQEFGDLSPETESPMDDLHGKI